MKLALNDPGFGPPQPDRDNGYALPRGASDTLARELTGDPKKVWETISRSRNALDVLDPAMRLHCRDPEWSDKVGRWVRCSDNLWQYLRELERRLEKPGENGWEPVDLSNLAAAYTFLAAREETLKINGYLKANAA